MVHRDGYSSDDSTPYSRASGHRHRRRRSSPSEHRRRRHRGPRDVPPPREERESSTAGTLVKLGLGVALVQIVATCFSKWMQEKRDAHEREHRHEKRRAFEEAKAKRRRDEEDVERRREREEDEDEGESDWNEREIIIREGRRIGYVPAEGSHAREFGAVRRIAPAREFGAEGEVRRIAPASDHDHDHDHEHEHEEWDDARRRAPSVAARSRSRYGRTTSVSGVRDGRNRSRPAERVA